MSGKIKLWAYIVLAILAIRFGCAFHSNYTAVVNSSNPSATNATVSANQPADKTSQAVPPGGQGNVPNAINGAASNAAATTNEIGQTNDTVANNQVAVTGGTSNSVEETNRPPPPPPSKTKSAASTAAPPSGAQAAAPPPVVRSGQTVGYLFALVVVLIGLGCLIAYDVTHLMGSRAVDLLFNDRGEGAREPEYEKAEQVWANGDFLEAIQLMRDYLKKNKREQFVALRIAEIYEKDLKNYLAAVLEYEEILKKKLPDERWGWAAIHLCNLYSKMNQPAKTMALLERIANEYPKTGAAKKARARLGIAETAEEEQPQEEEAAPDTVEPPEGQVLFEVVDPEDQPPLEDEEPPPPRPPPPPPEPKSKLPPGFRPKK